VACPGIYTTRYTHTHMRIYIHTRHTQKNNSIRNSFKRITITNDEKGLPPQGSFFFLPLDNFCLGEARKPSNQTGDDYNDDDGSARIYTSKRQKEK
jgi:hypothetical protein